jgi:DNA repair ATPase RecN
MGIGGKVLAMRRDLTCEEIADEINRRYLPAGEEPVTKMTVSRYCTAHGMTDMQRNNITKSVTHFDSLAEAQKVRNRLVKHTNKLSDLLDELKEDEEKLSEIASISNAYLNCCKQLSELNRTVSQIQREQLGLQKVRKVLSVVISLLEKYPEVKAQVFEELRKSEVYDTIRSI